MTSRCVACLLALVSLTASDTARADEIEKCLRSGTDFAICNGIVGGIAGLGSVGIAGATLASQPSGANVYGFGFGLGLGLYSTVSGALLITNAERLASDDPLQSTARAVGWLDLAVGGLGLTFTAVAGIRMAIFGTAPDDDREESEFALSLSPGVAGSTGPAAGATATLAF